MLCSQGCESSTASSVGLHGVLAAHARSTLVISFCRIWLTGVTIAGYALVRLWQMHAFMFNRLCLHGGCLPLHGDFPWV